MFEIIVYVATLVIQRPPIHQDPCQIIHTRFCLYNVHDRIWSPVNYHGSLEIRALVSWSHQSMPRKLSKFLLNRPNGCVPLICERCLCVWLPHVYYVRVWHVMNFTKFCWIISVITWMTEPLHLTSVYLTAVCWIGLQTIERCVLNDAPNMWEVCT